MSEWVRWVGEWLSGEKNERVKLLVGEMNVSVIIEWQISEMSKQESKREKEGRVKCVNVISEQISKQVSDWAW